MDHERWKKKLWSRVRKYGPLGCWEWTGLLTHNGYPKLARVRVHRWTYEEANGPIPEGMLVRHTCNNRICVNPKHLKLGTAADNTLDMLKSRRQASGSRVGTSKLTEQGVEDIRKAYAAGEHTQKELGELYGVCDVTIHLIVTGKTWANSGFHREVHTEVEKDGTFVMKQKAKPERKPRNWSRPGRKYEKR